MKRVGIYGILIICLNAFMLHSVYAQESSTLKYLPIKQNGLWGVIDLQANILLEPKFDFISNIQFNNYIIVENDSKRGLYNVENKEIIPIQYDKIVFIDSTTIKVYKNSKWGIFSLNHPREIECKYTQISPYQKNIYKIESENGCGLYSTKFSKEIVHDQNAHIRNISDNLFLVYKDSLHCGVFNTLGTEVLECKFTDIDIVFDTLLLAKENNTYAGYTRDGIKVFDSEWQDYAKYYNLLELIKNNKSALFNTKTMSFVVSANYESYSYIGPSYIRTHLNNKVGLIDYSGNEIVAPTFDNILSVLVMDGKELFWVKNGISFGIVSLSGKIIVPTEYDFIQTFSNNLFLVWKNGRQGVINAQGTVLYEPIAQKVLIFDDVIKVYENDKLSMIDITARGEEIERFEYENVSRLQITQRLYGSELRPISNSNQASVSSGGWYYSSKLHLWGIKDSNNIIRISPRFATYRDIQGTQYSLVYEKVLDNDFYSKKYGNYTVTNNYKIGLIDNQDYKYLIRPQYSSLDTNVIHSYSRATLAMTDNSVFNLILSFRENINKSCAYIGLISDSTYRYNIGGNIVVSNAKTNETIASLSDFITRFDPNSISINYNSYNKNDLWVECRGGKWGTFDYNGNNVIPVVYQYLDSTVHNTVIAKKNANWGVLSKNGNVVLPFDFNHIEHLSQSHDSLFLVQRNTHKEGVMNKYGKILTLCEYDYIYDYYEGLAAVRVNNKYGYINKDGKLVIEPIFRKAKDFSEGLAAVKGKNKWGYINTSGEWVISEKYSRCGDFKEGSTWFFNKGRYGYINTADSVLIKPKYKFANNFESGLAIVKKNHKYGVINSQNKWVIRPRYSKITQYASDSVFVIRNSKGYGVMSNKGEKLVKCENKKILDFNQGYVAFKKDKLWGYYNNKGELIIEPIYKGAQTFNDGYAGVKTSKGWGYINSSGEFFVEPMYNKIIPFNNKVGIAYDKSTMHILSENGNVASTFKSAKTNGFNSNYAVITKGAKSTYINNNTGTNTFDNEEYSYASSFYDDIAFTTPPVNQDEVETECGYLKDVVRYRMINSEGKELVPTIFSSVRYLNEGMVAYEMPAYFGVYDLEGNVVLEPIYESITYMGSNIFKVQVQNQIGYITTDGTWIWEIAK